MLRNPSFRTTVVPLLLALIALAILNFGLYRWLLAPSQAAESTVSLPYSEDFAQTVPPDFTMWGGTWEQRDETLVQMNTTGFDLGTIIPIKIEPDQSYEFSARTHFLGGSMGGGLLFNVQQVNSRQKSHMARFNVDGGKLYIIYGYFGDDSNFVGQGSIELELDPLNVDWHKFAVSVGPLSFAISLDDQTLATGIPLQYQGGAVGLVSSSSQVAFDDLSVIALDPASVPSPVTLYLPATAEVAAASTLDTSHFSQVFADSFTSTAGENTNWVPFSGTWGFEPGAFVQTDAGGFDFGAGSRALYSNPIHLQVTLSHRQGVGGGVLFNMPQPDSKNGAYMVRYIDDSNLTWGYFDTAGAFVGQGGVPVDPPATDAHTLDIVTGASSYSIVLDGSMIAQNIPLSSSGGHIGLTASQSVVAFTSVIIDAADGLATPEVLATSDAVPTSSTNVNLNSISGTWMNEGGIVTQSEDIQSDAVAGVGIAAATFRVSVDITLPRNIGDAGGGLIFHMNGRDDVAGGSMVRFAAGGEQVFWGVYDDQRIFNGQGSSALTLTSGEPHKLTLVVRAVDYDILVDDQSVASAVPLTSVRGWIGLISFHGPVEFRNFELALSEG